MIEGIILKLTAYCNLNCSYCYMFNLEDKSYQQMPKNLSIETLLKLMDRIEEYYLLKDLKEFRIILHGGEPFLWGMENFKKLLDRINRSKARSINLVVAIQTNLFKLDRELLRLFDQHNVSIGVSIDGPKSQHDRYRVTHNGKPTYQKIMENLNTIIDLGFSRSIGGFLTVSDPTVDPAGYFEWIKQLPIKNVNVLWPIEFNYNNTPWDFYHMEEDDYLRSPIYGKWFSELFRIWWLHDDPHIAIRMFYEIISNILGSRRHSDSIVNDQLNMCVINTDGSFEYHDYFRAFKDSAVITGYNIVDHSFIEFENDPIMKMLFGLKDHLPSNCQTCKHKLICGGGFLPGRMEVEILDFKRNNSILCYDYYYLFETVKTFLPQNSPKMAPATRNPQPA
jgi:uncharacterized protein